MNNSECEPRANEIRKPELSVKPVRYSFGWTGRDFEVVFGGAPAFYLRPLLGSRYLDYQLHQPWEVLTSFDLEVKVQPEKGLVRARNSIQAGSDAHAFQDYRQDLDRVIAAARAARAAGRDAEVARLREEIRLLELVLRGGSVDNDTLERARSNVWHAVDVVRRQLPRLGPAALAFDGHLEECLSLGFKCVYQPPAGVVWL